MVCIFNSIQNEKFKEFFGIFPNYTLSDFQKFAIEAIVKGQHSLSCVPTGSGKTLPAVFAIQHYTQLGKKVIYTSPIKALSNQKYYEFSQKFPNLSIGILTGDFKINPSGQVLIMTAEILSHRLQYQDENQEFFIDFENDVGCIIHDEIHYINDANRGHVWENCILHNPVHVPMVMLSATLDNPTQFASWIESTNSEKKVYLHEETVRSVPLEHFAYFTTTNQLMKRKIADKEKNSVLELQDCLIPLQNSNGTLKVESWDKIESAKKILTLQSVRMDKIFVMNSVCKKMVERNLFPAVCFMLSKKQLEHVANNITTDILEFDSKVPYTIDKICEQFLRKKITKIEEFKMLTEYTNLMVLLRKGIAIHHSSMIPMLRELVEILFEQGYIKLLIATETFSIGLNMPIRTAIFHDLRKFDGTEWRFFHPHEFVQASGRAGRRGIDTKGTVIHLVNLYRDTPKTTVQQLLKGNPPCLKSKFKISYDLILDDDFTNMFEKSMFCGELLNKFEIKFKEVENLKKNLEHEQKALKDISVDVDILEKYKSLKKKNSRKNYKKIRLLEEQNNWLLLHEQKNNTVDIMEKKLSQKESKISEERGELQHRIDKMKEILLQDDFITKDGTVTKRGNLLKILKEMNGIVVIPFINDIRKFSTEKIILYLSCMSKVCHCEMENFEFDNYENDFESVLKNTNDRMKYLEKFEFTHGLNTGEEYLFQTTLMPILEKWLQCSNEIDCLSVLAEIGKHVQVGDFIKTILQIVQMALQLESWAKIEHDLEFQEKLCKIPNLLMKSIVSNQSLYV